MTRRVKQSRPMLANLADNFMNRVSSTDARLRRKIAKYGLWVLCLVIVYSLMSGTYGVPRIIRLKIEKSALIEANRELAIEIVDADRIKQLLKYDRDYIEKIARSRYYMVYPNETIYRYRGR
ncbi:MAG: septum formation initiator family protein [bacterium]|nr:septum formation initiator family protein [bacterium]